ncbi:MAG: DNA-3-methyladenine glycosylase 2 family protein [Clostridiales bacterium]|nr:DNA-3-methyladenine glycosylase 2 family protein [Clostridiales bacterium]
MIIKHIDFFDPGKIADSGQAFRIHQIDEKHTELVAFGRYLQIAELGAGDYAFSCDEDEFGKLWHSYFDLDRDYLQIVRNTDASDTFLHDAISFGEGIRILKQDIFETVISYIISQRRSIPSITTCVDRLSELLGDRIDIPKLEDPFVEPIKKEYYAFPTVKQASLVSAEALNGIGAGYRTPYILSAIEDFRSVKLSPEAMSDLSDDELYKALTGMYGVGVKVANCVMLFGFGRTGRFPVDVWIKRIEDRYYRGYFDASRYPETAGILQQFMFYYIRKGGITS